jgi:hypothetical protein
VLPVSVKALFVAAEADAGQSGSDTMVTWAGHTLMVPAAVESPRHLMWTEPAAEVLDDFAQL